MSEQQKWAVIRDAPRNGWAVIHPGDVFRGSDGLLECWDVHSRHGAWEEAMRYADTQARTVMVTLPRKAATIAEPFALALLAHARRKDRN